MKKNLRKDFSDLRNSLTQEYMNTASLYVLEHLKNMAVVQNSNAIASFVSFRSELPTDAINHWIIESGKKLLLPKVNAHTKEIYFYEVPSLRTLKPGAYGILEPDEILCKRVTFDSLEIVLTPGLAFDKAGYRLGYGGGYYDKLFSHKEVNALRIGIGFECQKCDHLPHDTFDLPLDLIVTDNSVETITKKTR